MGLRIRWLAFLAILGLLAFPSLRWTIAADDPTSGEAIIAIERPGEREFVKDLAHFLTDADSDQIKQIADRLMTAKAVPIIVVTINSMAEHSQFKLRIESFAHLLFDQWEIGPAEIDGKEGNRGILLLVSKKDRKARIELGAGWRRDQDRECQRIMQEQIIPHFKRDDYSGGILAGVKALDEMVREQTHKRTANVPAATGLQAAPPGGVPPVNRPLPQQFRGPPPQLGHRSVTSNGLPVAILLGIGAVVVVVIGKALRGTAATRTRGRRAAYVGNSFWGSGPFGWQNWMLYEMSRQNWQHQQGVSSTPPPGMFDGGMSHMGGGFSHGGGMDMGSSASTFGGGSSGGGGATGSW